MTNQTKTTGMAIDSSGNIAYDPSSNVLALVKEAVKRIDDIHALEMKRIDEKMRDHFDFTQKLFDSEKSRIDAIRAVDVGAVAIASERSAAQTLVLANQVSTSAETLRALVSSTAATVASQLKDLTTQLTERISLLEKAQSELKGSSTPTTMQERIGVMERRQASQGGREGLSTPILLLIASLVGGIVVFIIEKLIP